MAYSTTVGSYLGYLISANKNTGVFFNQICACTMHNLHLYAMSVRYSIQPIRTGGKQKKL